MATIRDVARKAQVSVATVSAVLNENKYVSNELKQRVHEAIDELQYRRNSLARNLAKQRSYTLAYVIPCVTNPIFAQTLRGVQDIAWENGYDVVLYNTDFKVDKYVHYINLLADRRVDGVVMSAVHHDKIRQLVTEMKSTKIPIVIVHAPKNIIDVDTVLVDEAEGAYKATKYLIDGGNTRIGFIGVESSTASNTRLKGYECALRERKIPLDSELIQIQSAYSREAGISGGQRLLERRKDITAIFACADILAVGCMAAASNMGLKIGEDLLVVGFDDSLADFGVKQLTTVQIPAYEMGNMAGKILLERIDQIHSEECHPQNECIRQEIHPILKVRETTGKRGKSELMDV